MFLVDTIILIASLLVLAGILSRKFSARFGVPMLVLFVLVGMLDGSEGIGGIAFESYEIAHAVGTLALAVILFDGGLRTPLNAVRVAWKPALSMATIGVLITAALTAVAAKFLLALPLLEALLLGSIVASTDAAAVFSILRSQGLRLQERLGSTLELESGSNDPMAVLLTVALIELITGQMELGPELAWLFVQQMGIGAVVGVGVGWLSARLIHRINLDAAGLYPVLAVTCGFLGYAVAANLGGSGFLAVYLTGIVLGNSRPTFQRGIFLFLDGTAWIAQIVMFVLLGLVVVPSQLLDVAWEGLALALILMLVARPVAVIVSLVAFRFSVRELTFLSWAGLKGAVPIILATYPLLLGELDNLLMFNVVFFVVLVSALLQGWSLPYVARRLRLDRSEGEPPPVTLEITSLKHVDADIVDYAVGPDAHITGYTLANLDFPADAVVALVVRDNKMIPPRGSTQIQPGDHVFVVLRPDSRDAVDAVFTRRS